MHATSPLVFLALMILTIFVKISILIETSEYLPLVRSDLSAPGGVVLATLPRAGFELVLKVREVHWNRDVTLQQQRLASFIVYFSVLKTFLLASPDLKPVCRIP
jgi:hypothetical protein